MQLSMDFHVEDFAEAKHGRMLIASVNGGQTVYGVKGFIRQAGGELEDIFLAIAPATENHENRTGMCESVELSDHVVIDVDDVCCIFSHVSPAELLQSKLFDRLLIGWILSTVRGSYLYVRITNNRVFKYCFLDLKSGEILEHQKVSMDPNTPHKVIKQWDLKQLNKDGQWVTKYEYTTP